jgi:2-hydroxychromene-2-carboxylate isomerase
VSAAVHITLWTDPACPFAFSAEPVRQRLRWLYGDGLRWRPRMIVLTREEGHAERLAGGGAGLGRCYGMPISAWPYPRPASCEPACLAVVAARELADGPEVAERLLRALRVRTMAGGLLDEPELLDGAAADAGLEARQLRAWMDDPVAREALERDAAQARAPSAQARALDHKLGGPPQERRYTAPSYELERAGGSRRISVPGFNPSQIYETAIANLAPQLRPRAAPESVAALLAWAAMPLATAEVVEIMGRPQVGDLDLQASHRDLQVGDLDLQASHRDLEQELRDELGRCALASPAGGDMYWSLTGA